MLPPPRPIELGDCLRVVGAVFGPNGELALTLRREEGEEGPLRTFLVVDARELFSALLYGPSGSRTGDRIPFAPRRAD